MKALNSTSEKESKFEPHHRSSFTKTMTDNWYINNSLKESVDKNLQTLKATDRLETDPIKERVTRIEDKRKDLIKERCTIESVRDIINEDKERGKMRKGIVKETPAKFERQKSLIETSKEERVKEVLKKENSTLEESLRGKLKEEIEQKRTNTIVQDKAKEMTERQNSEKICRKLDTKDEVGKVIKDMLKPKENSSKESLRRKLDTKDEIGKVNKGRKNNNNGNLKEKANSDSVVKVKVEKVEVVNRKDKKCNSLKEKIDERLKSIERDIIYTQTDSLTELTKKMKILNTPLQTDRKRDIAVLNTTELSNNEKTDRHISNIICHKCKEYGHTKKQCDRHNKIIKQISKLEFEKDIINELMEIFNVSQKEIDQVKKELKSTNPLKINKRKRKQKDIIMKLIENLPNHHKDKKEYLLILKDSIEIPIVCIRCRKYGHHVTKCRKKEKAKDKKEKTKMKQDGIDIKPITLQDLMT